MDMLYRTAPPVYRGCHVVTTQDSSFLSGIGCSLFGTQTPVYKGLDGNGAPASSSARCWWQLFSAGTPSYKTASGGTCGSNLDASSSDDTTDPTSDCPPPDAAPPVVVAY